MIPSEYWWRNLSGPMSFVNDCAQFLLGYRVVVLQVPDDIPWRHEMREAVRDGISDSDPDMDLMTETMDGKEDLPEEPKEEEIGKVLLDHFASSDPRIRNGWRQKDCPKIQKYIRESGILDRQLVWFKGLSGKQTMAILSFLQTDPGGMFVVETHIALDRPGKFQVIYYQNEISTADVLVFSSVLLDAERSLSPAWRDYAAHLAARLCEEDAEVADRFLSLYDPESEDLDDCNPHAILRKLSEEEDLSRRGSDPTSENILGCVRRGKWTLINARIWRAQLEVLFPLIEEERTEILRLYQEKLQEALANNRIEQNRERITDIWDLEVGTIYFMLHSYRENDSTKLILEIDDAVHAKRIGTLRSARNTLAHIGVCTPEMVKSILEDRPSY